MTYLIFDKVTKMTKIGKSNLVNKRFSCLKIGNQNIILAWVTDLYTEEFLHNKFAEKRIGGEWFALDKNDYKFVIGSNKNIPKTLFYKNTLERNMLEIEKFTKNKVLNKKELHNITKSIVFKWKLDFTDLYKWTTEDELYNVKTMRKIKKTVNGYSVGYWICGKFITLESLRKHLVKIEKIHCPF